MNFLLPKDRLSCWFPNWCNKTFDDSIEKTPSDDFQKTFRENNGKIVHTRQHWEHHTEKLWQAWVLNDKLQLCLPGLSVSVSDEAISGLNTISTSNKTLSDTIWAKSQDKIDR